MLAAFDGTPVLSEAEIGRLDAAQHADPVPEDRWRSE